ncbi:hypothetical protein SARC_00013 [Sphaeroforma arctica JP610]|uniref:Uncharacterized protein n=1 Tax=Sphaeroforma arctica JP610 TaxID=667725 RepID=A0A0L0GG82_9EUKA|nr:hypothetical protein SARC_00013 [Sphaeroforma arctica JP610]KNC87879.1 hypothetical protein SARC_00013 [Sphaeroforma arctica JP610]|eukprot:XP_014161781.1 hypothetical protein SARC_00013 [Sphaeroforma arctica JP610]
MKAHPTPSEPRPRAPNSSSEPSSYCSKGDKPAKPSPKKRPTTPASQPLLQSPVPTHLLTKVMGRPMPDKTLHEMDDVTPVEPLLVPRTPLMFSRYAKYACGEMPWGHTVIARLGPTTGFVFDESSQERHVLCYITDVWVRPVRYRSLYPALRHNKLSRILHQQNSNVGQTRIPRIINPKAAPNKSKDTTAQTLMAIYDEQGFPRMMQSNMGSEFVN